jgi:hypothetical protein
MPYIVCVNRPGYLPEADPTAVATLEDARECAAQEIARANVELEGMGDPAAFTPHERFTADESISEDGGLIYLPDGYVVSVDAVTWTALAHLAEMPMQDSTEQEVLDAYNGQGG